MSELKAKPLLFDIDNHHSTNAEMAVALELAQDLGSSDGSRRKSFDKWEAI